MIIEEIKYRHNFLVHHFDDTAENVIESAKEEVYSIAILADELLMIIGKDGPVNNAGKRTMIDKIYKILAKTTGSRWLFETIDRSAAEALAMTRVREVPKEQAAAARRARQLDDAARKNRLQSAVREVARNDCLVDSDKYAESILDQVRDILKCEVNETWPSKRTVRRAVHAIIELRAGSGATLEARR